MKWEDRLIKKVLEGKKSFLRKKGWKQATIKYSRNAPSHHHQPFRVSKLKNIAFLTSCILWTMHFMRFFVQLSNLHSFFFFLWFVLSSIYQICTTSQQVGMHAYVHLLIYVKNILKISSNFHTCTQSSLFINNLSHLAQKYIFQRRNEENRL